MKRLVLLSLLLFPIFLFAQYPTFSNKQKLGVQTTGDGLIYRGDLEIPNYQPSNVNNAYFYLDTVRNTLKFYKGGWIQIYPAPQFDTTTLNVYLKISDTTAMLLPYFRDSDTTQLNLINRFALKLNISDTSVMLSPYLRKADTISLSNRIDLKFNTSDTTILSNRITTNANNIITINTKLDTKLDTIYVKFKDVVTRVLNKDTINIGSSLIDGYAINIIGDSINIDTTVLDIRYPDRDSTNELQDITFATTSGVVTISGGKVMNLDTLYDSVIDSVKNLIQDSIAAFIPVTEGYGINIIGDSINIDTTIIFTQSDTITLSNRIDLKLNKSDTISLSNRINTKLDTIYVNYQTSIDTIVNKDTINITTLEAGAGINIVNNVISLDTVLLDSVVRVQNVYVKNGTGTVLNKGEAVYVTGANGTNIIVGRASNVAESTSSKTLGLTMTSIPVNGFGYVIKEGLLAGLNTNSATEGDPIWLGVNGGLIFGLTNKPFAPKHLVYLGIVTRKQTNNGEVYVTVQNGFEIKELHDVQIIDPVDKASLYYNSSESLWRDTTPTLLVSDTASMLNPYLRKLDTITLSNRINLKFNTVDTAILGYVTTYSNQLNINGNKTFNNTVSVDSLNATKQAKIQSLTVGKGGSAIVGGIPGGISSTAFGFEALKNNTSGDYNTAIGYQSLLNNITAWNNVAIGNNSLYFNNSGEYNTAIGIESLSSNVSGNGNTAIGYYAGTVNKGSNNIYIGNQTYHTDSINNTLMIGGINTPLLSGITTGNKKLGVNTNPLNLTYTFEVNSPISNSVKINSNTNSTNLELMNSDGSVFIKSSNKNMTLQTDTTALVYLKGDVNRVGILTMNPEQALEVAGTIRVDSLDNNLTPVKLVGSNSTNDLTDVKLGTGLSISNDTLKIADNIINSGDTATLLRQDFLGINTNVLVWTQGNKKLLSYFTQVYRNGQLLKSDSQYTITSDSIVTLEEGSYRLNDNITIIAIDNVIALAGSGGIITLQGDVSGSGTNTITTTIGTGKVTNTMLAGSISNNKLDVITTAGKVSNSATTATSNNTNNAIVSRDASGNFSAGTITASLNGNANTATNVAYSGLTGTVPTWNQNTTGNAATVTTNANLNGDITSVGNTTTIASGVIVNADINNSAAIAVSKLAASTISGITLGNNLNTLTISSPLTGTSYNGSNAVSIGLQAATTLVAGSMSAADKTKLDGIAAGAQVNVATNLAQGTRTTTTVPITSSTGTSATLDIATTTLAGVMSSADKTKLDGIASGATANTGTVTSVSGTGTVSGLTLTGTVTTTGNLTLGGTLAVTPSNFASQTANTILAAPNGSAGVPTFRTLVAADIPTLNQNTTGTASNVTGTVAVANGGTALTSIPAKSIIVANTANVYAAISPTAGQSIRINAGNTSWETYTPTTGTVTSVAALTLGTTGTDLSSSVATGTTTPVITLNVPNASASNRGVLTSTDWTTFNSKQAALGFTPANSTITIATTAPLQGGGNLTANRTLSITQATTSVNGFLTSTDWNTFNNKLNLTGGTLTGDLYAKYLNTFAKTTYIPFDVGIGENLTNISSAFRGGTIMVFPDSNLIGSSANVFLANKLFAGEYSTFGSGMRNYAHQGGDIRYNSLALYTSGSGSKNTNRLYINFNGDIGINDDTPSYKLEVNGTLGVTSAATFSNQVNLGNSGSNLFTGSGIITDPGNLTGIKLYDGSLGSMTIFNKSTSPSFGHIIFSTGNSSGVPSERMRVTHEGNVNITNSLNVGGPITLTNLGGNGNRMLVTNNSGLLSTQAIPSGVEPNLYIQLNGPTIVLSASMGSQSTYFLHIDNVSTVTVTLPTASLNTNKSITIKNAGSGAVISNATNVQRLTGTLTNSILLSGGGKFATLVSDGFNWITMAAN